MEREEFAVAVSWIAEDDVQYWRPDLRSELGRYFGWTESDPWYRDREKLDKVHAFILERQSDSFRELKEKAVDIETRQRWLDSVVKLTRPVEPASEKPDPGRSQAQPRGSSAAGPRQSWVRSEPSGKAARGSPFGSRAQAQGRDAAASAGAGPAATKPDRRSTFGSRAQAHSQGSSPDARTGTPVAGAPPTADRVDQVAEQVQAMISELPAEELSTIADELELSPEEVTALMREPDFARLVAEERARLG